MEINVSFRADSCESTQNENASNVWKSKYRGATNAGNCYPYLQKYEPKLKRKLEDQFL